MNWWCWFMSIFGSNFKFFFGFRGWSFLLSFILRFSRSHCNFMRVFRSWLWLIFACRMIKMVRFNSWLIDSRDIWWNGSIIHTVVGSWIGLFGNFSGKNCRNGRFQNMWRFWWLLVRWFDELNFNLIIFEFQGLRFLFFMINKAFYLFFYCFKLTSWSISWLCMSHNHFLSCKYFFPHFNRFLLELKINILFIRNKVLISWSWLSLKPLLFNLISWTVFFNKIHIFWCLKHFWKIDIYFFSVTKVNDITGTAWFGNLLKLTFKTQLLFCLNDIQLVWHIFLN